MREARAVWKTARAEKHPTQAKEGAPLSVQNEAPSQRQAAVYRLYAANGTLLYIGSSYNPERRYRDHYAKEWWPLVARRTEQWHPSKEAAYAAEMAAIAAEGPAHNHMGTPQYVPPSEKAAAQRRHISGELTVKEIMAKHGISRQSLHTYRQTPGFPLPVSRPGTGGLRWRESEVAAWFEANPPTPGKRTDLPAKQGEPAVSGYRHSGMSREDYEACEQLHATANLIEARWPGAHPTLVRDLRDLVDTINEEAAQDG